MLRDVPRKIRICGRRCILPRNGTLIWPKLGATIWGKTGGGTRVLGTGRGRPVWAHLCMHQMILLYRKQKGGQSFAMI